MDQHKKQHTASAAEAGAQQVLGTVEIEARRDTGGCCDGHSAMRRGDGRWGTPTGCRVSV